MADRERGLAQLERHARAAGVRARFNAVTARTATLSLFPILYAAVALTAVKLARGGPAMAHHLALGLAVPLGVLIAGVAHAALRQSPPFGGALALDHFYDLRDRVTNAITFSRLPVRERTPLMEAAIDDGVSVVDRVSPGRAVPLRLPRDLPVSVALALATAGLGLLEVPVVRMVPPAPHHVDALAVSADDAELFRRISDELQTSTTDPEALAGARRFNQLVEDLAARRLDRREVFRRLDELERNMKDPVALDGAALDDALDGIAKELDKSALAKPVASALADKRLADAEQAMRDLAKKVDGAKQDVDKSKLEALRQALKKSSETIEKKSAQSESARRDLEERRKRLLEKKQKQGLNEAEKQELDRTERQLEHLDRDKERSDAQSKQMSGLDKDLAKAAEDLMKDLGMGSKDLEKSAEDMNRTAQKQMSEEQKKELRRRIEEMRQILRQEGQGGRDRLKRMMAFGQRARGQGQGQQGQGQQGKQQGQGQGSGQGQGQGQRGQGQGQQGQGQDGKGEQQLVMGQGKPGAGNAVMMGPGGEMPGAGEKGDQPGGGGGGDPEEWGTGHDPHVQGSATHLKGQTDDVTAAAADTGQGAASSQVIYGAAQRGFGGRGYKKVYTDYQNVAEESLAKDEIPPGYRFYVRRYFQLIRPRD